MRFSLNGPYPHNAKSSLQNFIFFCHGIQRERRRRTCLILPPIWSLARRTRSFAPSLASNTPSPSREAVGEEYKSDIYYASVPIQRGHSSEGLPVTGHHQAAQPAACTAAPRRHDQTPPENNIYIFITFSLNTWPSVKQSHI